MKIKRGKKYKEKAGLVEKSKLFSPEEAIKLVKTASFAKFDESVDMAVKLGIDVKKAGTAVRGSVSLPHGTGKKVRVGAVVSAAKAKDAEAAGADIVGGEDLIEKIQGGFLDFDVLIATPDMMPKIGKLGKILGQKGLMPNPKSGTVTDDIKKAVSEIKAGKTEFKADKAGLINIKLGRVSFEESKLLDNMKAAFSALSKAKISGLEASFVKTLTVSSTMGPGIKIDPKKTGQF